MDREACDILSTLPTRLHDLLHRWSENSPDQPALLEADEAWTYRELELVVAKTATWLAAAGVRPGDRVMIVFENCKAFVAIFFALSQINALCVPVNARLSGRELDAIRDHCGARLVVHLTSVSSHALDHAKRSGAAMEEHGDLGLIGLSALEEAAVPETTSPDSADAVAAIIYTSGTTSKPKGVMLTHRNVLFSATAAGKLRFLTPADRVLGILPMSHATGLVVQVLGSLFFGGAVYLLPQFDPIKVSAVLQKYNLTVLYGVPFVFTQFLEYAKIRGIKSFRYPRLRVISCSGAPLLPEVKSAVEDLFGLYLQHAYGLTECSPGISVTRIDAPRTDVSAGPIYPGIEVKLVGPDLQTVRDGEVGEVWVRGPNVMKGYYNAPEETAKVINSEGWFNTQDLAKMENENLFVVGRKKDLIIRFGFNVYPSEVEGVFNMHPEIARSAVIGPTSEETGEQQIVAFVQPRPGSTVTSKELDRYGAQHLAFYKQPTRIYLVSDLPQTPSGKIAKAELAKSLENEFKLGNKTTTGVDG